MRLFLAVTPPSNLRRELALQLPPLARDIGGRWPPPENLHLTLVFLGEIDSGRLPEVENALGLGCRRKAFTVEWGGMGVFPSWSRARVAYLGVKKGGQPLSQLAAGLQQALPGDMKGAPGRRFTPHLTLARFRRPPAEDALRRIAAALAASSWRSRIEAVELIQSRLLPEGARYESIARRALQT